MDSFGITKVGEQKFDDLFASDLKRLAVPVAVGGSAKLEKGTLVVATTKTLEKPTVEILKLTNSTTETEVGSDSFTEPVAIFGVLADDINAGGVGMCYITGDFRRSQIKYDTSVTNIDPIIVKARTNGILIRNV